MVSISIPLFSYLAKAFKSYKSLKKGTIPFLLVHKTGLGIVHNFWSISYNIWYLCLKRHEHKWVKYSHVSTSFLQQPLIIGIGGIPLLNGSRILHKAAITEKSLKGYKSPANLNKIDADMRNIEVAKHGIDKNKKRR